MRQPIPKNHFRTPSLRQPRSARTVLLRMAADQERADRIRALKTERPDLTWRRIADHVGVSERAASDWQKKGGIEYANAEKLAALFEVDVDYIWRGSQNSDTPDPFAGTVEERLAQLADQIAADRQDRDENVAEIKALIDEQAKALREQAGVLGELRDAVKDLREMIATQRAAARYLEQVAEAASRALPDGPVRQPEQTGTSRET